MRRFIRVTKVAAIRIWLVNRNNRRDKIKGVVAGFCADGIFSGFGHVAVDTLAAGARSGVVCMVGDGLHFWPDEFSGAVTGEAERVRLRRFDRHRTVAGAVRIVAIGTLQPLRMHDAMREGVALDAVFVRGSIAPEFRRLLACFRLKAVPEI